MKEIPLTGLDGTNPLAYLAALGVLRAMDDVMERRHPTLRWNPESWHPLLAVEGVSSSDELVEILLERLRRKPGPDARHTVEAKKVFEQAQAEARRKRGEIKNRRLPRSEARAAQEAEVRPLQERADRFRQARLKESAPDPVVSLGANLTVSEPEFRKFCGDAATVSAASNRRWADFCAAFGCEYGGSETSTRMDPTPFALVSGAGHQDFLGSVAELMVIFTADHVREAILGPWRYLDEKYALRWDPAEDRRYALMAQDPTASGNKPRTVWGANRLAFEALPLFPCVPTAKGTRTLCVVGEANRIYFQWPLWRLALTLDSIRSLLGLRDLMQTDSESIGRCRARGVIAVYRSQRVKVRTQGNNFVLNFTPALPMWS